MSANDLNTALYEKMAAEQDKYRDWLNCSPTRTLPYRLPNLPTCPTLKILKKVRLKPRWKNKLMNQTQRHGGTRQIFPQILEI